MSDHHHVNHAADAATIADAWQEQLAQAATNPTLRATLRHAPPTLYRRFVRAYHEVVALSRGQRRRLLRRMGLPVGGAALALALALGQVPTARAASISVGGSCTLVDAITAANTDTATGGCVAGSGADIITLSGHVTLTSGNTIGANGVANGLPLITSAITIAGNDFTIARDPSAPAFRMLEVTASGTLTLNDTTITGGNDGAGGGIFNSGTLMLNTSTVSGNTAIRRGGGGGGIYTTGTATLINSTVSGNTASSAAVGNSSAGGGGSGIFNHGTLTLTNSTVSGNTADSHGAIYTRGTATLINSTVSGNTAAALGGGIFSIRSTLTLINSTISGNTAGGDGGGIFNAVDSTLTLERSLISGNTARAGQDIANFFDVRCQYDYYGTPICTTYAGTVISNGDNVFGHSGESTAQAFTNFTLSGSDRTATSDGTDPTALAAILGPLANNGGPTLTHALVTGSPAVDTAPTGPATDQRGIARPQGPAFDSGAFELEQATNSAPVATNDSYTTTEDTALRVLAPGVLGNDSDPDSDPLTAMLVSGPAHGTLTLSPTGAFTYTPAANYSGADSFTYTANDGTATSNVATVSLTVVSALDQIDALIAEVQALVTSGSLNGGQGNALITKLAAAADYVDSGQSAQAIARLQTFISQVNSFISSGVLTPTQGQPLIDKATAIIHSLGG